MSTLLPFIHFQSRARDNFLLVSQSVHRHYLHCIHYCLITRDCEGFPKPISYLESNVNQTCKSTKISMSPFTSATTIQMFTKQGIGKFISLIYSGSFPFRPQNVIRGIVQNTAVKPVSKLEIDIKVKIIGFNALQLILANRTRGDKIITLDKYMEKDKMTLGKNQSRIKWIIHFFFPLVVLFQQGQFGFSVVFLQNTTRSVR